MAAWLVQVHLLHFDDMLTTNECLQLLRCFVPWLVSGALELLSQGRGVGNIAIFERVDTGLQTRARGPKTYTMVLAHEFFTVAIE